MKFLAPLALLVLLGSCAASGPQVTPRNTDSGGRALWWDHFPLQLCADAETHNQLSWNVNTAAARWQERVGQEVFRARGNATCDVYITTEEGRVETFLDEEDAGAAIPYHDENGRLEKVIVIVRGYLDTNQMNRVIAHELGHAIGLAHSESSWSVMYKKATRNPWEIELADVKAVLDILAEHQARFTKSSTVPAKP